jgi:hypothetical protein
MTHNKGRDKGLADSGKEYVTEDRARLLLRSRLLLAFIILFVVFVRVRLLDFPLERDEGEYAYMGQLILQGIPPYSEAYNMKFPGTYLMYALVMGLFGQTTEGVHIGFMIVNCATILLVYLVARKIMGDFPAAIAGGTYAVLSLSSSVLGFAAHATHFVVLPAMAGTLILLQSLEKDKLYLYFLSGLLFGISVIMKQPGIFFVLFGATYILWRYAYSKLSGLQADKLTGLPAARLGLFVLGGALPLLITFLWLYAAGVFDRFWFWTFEYASKYGSQVPLSGAFSSFKSSFPDVADGLALLWGIAALGFLTMFFRRDFQHKVFMVMFVVSSFLTVCPGFYFRQHYFVTFLPAVSLLAGGFFDYLDKKGTLVAKSQYVTIAASGIFLAVVLVGVIDQKEYFFKTEPVRISRLVYGPNPFPESVEIANFIKANSSTTDRIAVLGSEPQIFFYSGRRSATGYIYTYSLMEQHDYVLKMQREMIDEIESSKPKFIVMVPINMSWLVHPNSEKLILNWSEDYLNRNYSLVGVADIVSPDLTIYKWYDDARNYMIQSEAHVLVYEKKQ